MTTPKKATTNKAPAKKAAAKKTTTAAAKPRARAAAVAAPEAKPQPSGVVTKPIRLADRDILFRCPTLEQLVDLEDIFTKISESRKKGEDYATAKALINEYYDMIGFLIYDLEDVAWLRTAKRRGDITMTDENVVRLPLTIIELFKPEIEAMTQAGMNREQKRAAARKRA